LRIRAIAAADHRICATTREGVERRLQESLDGDQRVSHVYSIVADSHPTTAP
jgi:hypothetical protein